MEDVTLTTGNGTDDSLQTQKAPITEVEDVVKDVEDTNKADVGISAGDKEEVEQKEKHKEEKKEVKEKDALSKREEEISRREAEVARKEIEANAKVLLAEKGFSESVYGLVAKGTWEDTQTAINDFEEVFSKELERALDARLKGVSPKSNGGNIGTEAAGVAATFAKNLRA